MTLRIILILCPASLDFKMTTNFVSLESLRISQEEDRNWMKQCIGSEYSVHSESLLFREGADGCIAAAQEALCGGNLRLA